MRSYRVACCLICLASLCIVSLALLCDIRYGAPGGSIIGLSVDIIMIDIHTSFMVYLVAVLVQAPCLRSVSAHSPLQ